MRLRVLILLGLTLVLADCWIQPLPLTNVTRCEDSKRFRCSLSIFLTMLNEKG